MKVLFVFITVGGIWLARAAVALAQTNVAAPEIPSQSSGLTKVLSEKPFLGAKSVLTFGADHAKTPKEDFEMTGLWTAPLNLEEMHGVVAEIGFGDAAKQGEWQLRFKRKLMTVDNSWKASTDAARNVGLSDNRSQVLKASYNLKDWWQVGVSGLIEDKAGADTGLDRIPFGLHSGQSLGFQVDTLFKF